MKHYPELRIKLGNATSSVFSGLVLGTTERILTGGFTISDDGLISGPVADAINRFIDDSVATQCENIRTKRDALDAKAVAEGMAYLRSPAVRAQVEKDLRQETADKAQAKPEQKTLIDYAATHATAVAAAVSDAKKDASVMNPFGPISIGIIDASREKARRTGQYTEEQLDAMFGVDAAAAWEAMYSKASAAVAKDERETAHAAAVAEDCAALDVTQISFIDDEQQQQPIADDELADAASGAHQHVAVINVDAMTDTAGNSINVAGFKVVLDPSLPPYTVNVKMGDKVVGTCVINPETYADSDAGNITIQGIANITDPEALAAISAQGIAPSMGYSMAGAKSADGITWKKDNTIRLR